MAILRSLRRIGITSVLITLTCLTIPIPAATAALNWTQVTANAAWSTRNGSSSLAFDNKLWIMGGTGAGNLNDVWYSTNGAAWTQATASAGWPGRQWISAAVFDGRMWIMGGYDGANSLRDVWYTTNGSAWTQAAASANWPERYSAAALSFGGRLWIMGAGPGNDVWYTTNGASWTAATNSAPWLQRLHMRSVDFAGKMWMYAGYRYSPGYANDVWQSADGASWTQIIGNAPWPQRASQGVVVFDGKMWVMGGESPTRNDVWFSTDGISWTQDTAAAGWSPRYDVQVVTHQNAMWVIGGYGAPNDVWTGSFCTAPSITTPPSDQTISDCSPAIFTVTAGGTSPFTYQWRRNGGNLSNGGHVSGATTNTLTINPVGTADEGGYDIVVTNACGNATGGPVMLTLVFGDRGDCNTNGVPDECEIGGGLRTWNGPDGGAFTAAGNWTPSGVPGVTNEVVLANATSNDNRCVLNAGGTTQICSLTISATGSGEQILQVSSGSELQPLSEFDISSGGQLDLQGGRLSGAALNNAGTLTGFGAIANDVSNAGLIHGLPDIDSNLIFTGSAFSNQPTGDLRAAIGSLIVVHSPNTLQQGDIEIRAAAAIDFRSTLTNAAGATIRLFGGVLGTTNLTNDADADIYGFGTLDVNLDNQGLITVIADTQIVGNLLNNGTIAIQNGILTVTGNVAGSGVIIGGFGG